MTESKCILAVGVADGSTDSLDDIWDVVHAESDESVDAMAEQSVDCIVVGDGEVDVIDRLDEEASVPILYAGPDWQAALSAGATDCLPEDTDMWAVRLENVVDAARFRCEERTEKQRQQIERLHDVGVELAGSKSESDVYELMVSAAEDILDLDLCVADSVEDGRLTSKAVSAELPEYDEPPVDSPEAGIAGKAYRNDESFLIEDVRGHPDAEPAGDYLSGVTVPIGDFGVFQAVSTELGTFDRTDMELVEILAEHVREALRRLEQEQKLRERREQLARENERLDEFASVVSHDLRNPLNVAQLRLNLVKEETEESKHIATIDRSLTRMETIIADVLTLARDGQTVSEFEEIGLKRVTNAAWRNVDTGGATLEADQNPQILADESRLQQLIENLIRNAIDHAAPAADDLSGLAIRVEPFEEGFYVADNGVGIPGEVRDNLFDAGISTDAQGSGLGLAIVSRIAQAHGWSVTATDAEGGGARFEITGVEFVAE